MDAGYLGVEKRPEIASRFPSLTWHVPAMCGKTKALPEGRLKDLIWRYEKAKAQLRSRVEQPFHLVKNAFRHYKVRYCGLTEYTAQLQNLFVAANLFITPAFTADCRSAIKGVGENLRG